MLIALPALDRTGGTEDTIKKALKLKKQVVLIELPNNTGETDGD